MTKDSGTPTVAWFLGLQSMYCTVLYCAVFVLLSALDTTWPVTDFDDTIETGYNRISTQS